MISLNPPQSEVGKGGQAQKQNPIQLAVGQGLSIRCQHKTLKTLVAELVSATTDVVTTLLTTAIKRSLLTTVVMTTIF